MSNSSSLNISVSTSSFENVNYHPELMQTMAKQARATLPTLFKLAPIIKKMVLDELARLIEHHVDDILQANQNDVQNAKAQNRYDEAFMERLILTAKSVAQMVDGIRQVAQLEEVIGQMYDFKVRPNGLKIGKMRVPIGVIGMIYESRPNVTIDAAILCFKSGNACILRGGSEAMHCNLYLHTLIQKALQYAGVPVDAVQLVPTPDRRAVDDLLRLDTLVDVIIPRGGKSLIEKIMQNSKIPMIKHLDGICHTFVDESADLAQAVKIAVNAKCQRYGACNTMETLIIHQAIAKPYLSQLISHYQNQHVLLRADEASFVILEHLNYPFLEKATEEDWKSEYLAPILSIKMVENVEQAIHHINHYGSKHTDAILSQTHTHIQQFLCEVDSASVMVNTSTRFADGYEYGFGSEIGISNDKLHARGPVGLIGLTSEKYIVYGEGQCRG